MTTTLPPDELPELRLLLSFLAGLRADPGPLVTREERRPELGDLLIRWELAPLAAARLAGFAPELVRQLHEDRYGVLAHNALHWQNLDTLDAAFTGEGITAVLLKGAALASTVYDEPAQRPMSDVDLWLQKKQMGAACATMAGLGFQATQSAERPLALQALADGEVQFIHEGQTATLVELHLSPFGGWWLQRAAAVDLAALWARRERLPGWGAFYQLDPQDTIIHLAVHMAISHQFGLAAVRSLVDMALTAQVRHVDWVLVAERAQQWRVATAVWLALSLLQELLALPGLEETLRRLQPAPWRQQRLQQLVSPSSILEAADMREARRRFWLLLLLVDRPRDAVRLIYRALWPEAEWRAARYGRDVSAWYHLRQVLRTGTI